MTLALIKPYDSSPARYWRVRGTAMRVSQYFTLGELYFLSPTGVDMTVGGTPFASGSYSAGPGALFDKNAKTKWSSSGSLPMFVGYDFGSPVTIGQVRLVNQDGIGSFTNENPKDYSIQRSADNATWTDVAVVTNDPAWGDGEVRLITFSLSLTISGIAKLDNGSAASRIYAFNWDTGASVGITTPAADGTFSLNVSTDKVGVVVTGPAGYRPVTHGPIVGNAT